MGSSNHAQLYLLILVFYGALTVIFGFIGQTGYADSQTTNVETHGFFATITEIITDILDFLGFESLSFFIGSVGFTLSGIPAWINVLIFIPLGLTLVFVLLDLFIPG